MPASGYIYRKPVDDTPAKPALERLLQWITKLRPLKRIAESESPRIGALPREECAFPPVFANRARKTTGGALNLPNDFSKPAENLNLIAH